MSKYVIDGTTLTAIADAVREKGGTTEKILVSDIASAIAAIEAGGAAEGLTAEDLAFTGAVLQYTLAGNLGKAIVENYGSLITFTDITNAPYMFSGNTADVGNFEIKCKDLKLSQFLQGCSSKRLPKLTGTITTNKNYSNNSQYIFSNFENVREIPSSVYENIDWTVVPIGMYYAFNGLTSLRTAPMEWINQFTFSTTSGTYAGYNGAFGNCSVLDELIDYPVNNALTVTSNMMSGFCSRGHRIKDITFKTNEDGSPIVVQWKSQTLELYNYFGWSTGSNSVTDYNSGITADKEVKDDATYAALKDDPDWFTNKPEYSRYNHDSAVNTINSLPDTSAYLASAGGTNTIKFRGAAGSATDGGAINTLTAEEIAVATAKGWTVTFS